MREQAGAPANEVAEFYNLLFGQDDDLDYGVTSMRTRTRKGPSSPSCGMLRRSKPG